MHIADMVRRSYEVDLGAIGAFLPARVPADDLPGALRPYLAACGELPARYPRDGGGVRAWLDELFRDDPAEVGCAIEGLDGSEADALMTALCVLGHTYRWDCVPPTAERFAERSIALPPGIAGPWSQLARRLDQPRVGSAWSLHLTNWTMPDRPGGSAYLPGELHPSTIRMAHGWLRPPIDAQLESFSLAFVLMEALGAAVLAGLVEACECAAGNSPHDLLAALDRVHAGILAMTLGFSRNVRPGTVDPAIWLEVIQPTFAWGAESDNPARIDGGPSGMQLGTIQALDACFSVGGRSAMTRMAAAARHDMPRRHRRFLETLDPAGPFLRSYVADSGSCDLTERFDACIAALSRFRVTHRARGAQYLRGRPPATVPRASTGLSIGIDDDPVTTFERAMNERISETNDAMLQSDRRRVVSKPTS
jgi:hypothetical protein